MSLSPPPPSYNPQSVNQLSLSPSSSLSSSSYANSSKSSSSACENSSNKSENSKVSEKSFSFSINNEQGCKFKTILPSINDIKNNKSNKKIINEKSEHVSFGKKLKRFLSLNSGSYKRQTENEKFDTLKKKIFQN